VGFTVVILYQKTVTFYLTYRRKGGKMATDKGGCGEKKYRYILTFKVGVVGVGSMGE